MNMQFLIHALISDKIPAFNETEKLRLTNTNKNKYNGFEGFYKILDNMENNAIMNYMKEAINWGKLGKYIKESLFRKQNSIG